MIDTVRIVKSDLDNNETTNSVNICLANLPKDSPEAETKCQLCSASSRWQLGCQQKPVPSKSSLRGACIRAFGGWYFPFEVPGVCHCFTKWQYGICFMYNIYFYVHVVASNRGTYVVANQHAGHDDYSNACVCACAVHCETQSKQKLLNSNETYRIFFRLHHLNCHWLKLWLWANDSAHVMGQ